MKKTFIILCAAAMVAGCGDGDGMGEPDGGGAEPRGADNRPALGAQIDRAGRPAVSTATINTFDGDSNSKGAAKDAYNEATPADGAGFVAQIKTSIAILDGLDTVCGNQFAYDDGAADGERYTPLATVLADDQLYIDSTQGSCNQYLALEGGVGGDCGGRNPASDVIETSYSVLAAGVFTGIDDTITANDVPFLTDFPFLAAPN